MGYCSNRYAVNFLNKREQAPGWGLPQWRMVEVGLKWIERKERTA
jgi:hypothetical protein